MTPNDFPGFQSVPSNDTSETLTLKVAMADYGRVRTEGIDLDITTNDIREFCAGPIYETFDVAQMIHRQLINMIGELGIIVNIDIDPYHLPTDDTHTMTAILL